MSEISFSIHFYDVGLQPSYIYIGKTDSINIWINAIVNITGYEAPIINGNTTVQAEVDMPVTLSYNVTSQTDNVEFVLISEPNSGLNKSRDGELFVLTWIPESLVPEQIMWVIYCWWDRSLSLYIWVHSQYSHKLWEKKNIQATLL